MTFTIPVELIQVIVIVLVSAILFFGGLLIGFYMGTKETERRWSDAVAKANYAEEQKNRDEASLRNGAT